MDSFALPLGGRLGSGIVNFCLCLSVIRRHGNVRDHRCLADRRRRRDISKGLLFLDTSLNSNCRWNSIIPLIYPITPAQMSMIKTHVNISKFRCLASRTLVCLYMYL
ncbi:hypothetical protein BDV37DRAFT_136654 [Aspergillus pseudonomiae]|uniref:Uncharacterized protein n=1 Tax=Aspergillus pseudonomiae TaxID=1506151 RepID=A0A5N7DQX5_9EURO|nr:uncharacterized protein BDV37DRAFT_136654 [Aspergillus pseudonomiae]KAE8408867.1 hypothetical protein BDV37DRAFT_136654 [Aspergillus pseudonomiae]